VTLRNVRAYYLWIDNPSLPLSTLGVILRNPHPLTVRQVIRNILSAIEQERLIFDHERARELLQVYRRGAGMEFSASWQSKYRSLERLTGFKIAEKETGEE